MALGDVLASDQPRSIRLAHQSPFPVGQVDLQVLLVFLETHPVHAPGCVLTQTTEAQAQYVLVEPPIHVAKPVVLVWVCLLGYGPQEGLPVALRRSYGSGCLCGLR